MSSTRGILRPHKLFDATTLNTTKTSNTVFCQQCEQVLFDIAWSGGGGGLNVAVTIEYDRGEDDWVDVGVNSPAGVSISGVSGTHQILIGGQQPNPFSKLRAKFTHAAGTATMSCTVSGKGT